MSTKKTLLCSFLEEIPIAPFRLSVETEASGITASHLRGVWGAALHDLSPETYARVFEGTGPVNRRNPGFVLSLPGETSSHNPLTVDFTLIGQAANETAMALRAWDIASGRGLGPARIPFLVRSYHLIDPGGETLDTTLTPEPWTLDRARWPLEGDPGTASCRLHFPVPLRLRREERLIEKPSLMDLAVASLRRLEGYLDMEQGSDFKQAAKNVLEIAKHIPFLQGDWDSPTVHKRYSGKQKREIARMGVAGYLDLPEGPGELWPLFAAARWLHIGKGATEGFGRMEIEPIPG